MSRNRAVLAVLCLAQLAFILDVSVVNVALVPLAADLAAGPAALQLVVAVYAATFGGVLLLGGRLADRGRARTVFIGGLLLFAASSALCGAAPSAAVLIAGRALQGLGAGLASPAALALLTTTFAEGPARNRALGTWAAVAAAGGAIGLLLGGVLTGGLGWRAVFYINVPLVLGIVVAARRIIRPDRNGTSSIGRVTLSAAAAAGAVVLVVVGLAVVERGAAVGGAALLATSGVLVAAQRVADRRSADPLVPLAVLGVRPVLAANVVTALLSAVVLGVNFFLALHLQGAAGLGPLATGLAFLPITAVSGITSMLAARNVVRFGARTLLAASMTAMAVGCLALLVAANGNYIDILPGLVLVAAGVALLAPRHRATTTGHQPVLIAVPAHAAACLPGYARTATR